MEAGVITGFPPQWEEKSMGKEYRGMSMVVQIAAIFLGIIYISLGLIMYKYYTLSGESNIMIETLIIAMSLIPGTYCIFASIREYSKKVIVKNGSVSYYHWGRHVRTFQKEEITVYGVAQFWARDAYIFYCRASEEEISRYWNTHKKMAKRMFKQYYNSLKESDEKLWQLMVGVYIRKKLSSMTSDIIITGCTYSVGFGEIVKIMNKRPILTGIVLLNDPGAWEDEIKKPGI